MPLPTQSTHLNSSTNHLNVAWPSELSTPMRAKMTFLVILEEKWLKENDRCVAAWRVPTTIKRIQTKNILNEILQTKWIALMFINGF